MLKLSTSFSKKVPVPDQEFSSQSYHASVELELSDALEPAQVEQKIHETFEMVRSAVEAELKGQRAVVLEPAPQPAKPPVQNGSQPTGKASNKQIKYLLDLAGQQGYELSALTAHVRKLYGVQSVYDLDKKQASALLDSLKIRKAA
jgi:hypothetical protein